MGLASSMSIAAGAVSRACIFGSGSVGRQLREQLAGNLRPDLPGPGTRMVRRYSRLSSALVGSHLMATVTGAAPCCISAMRTAAIRSDNSLVMSTIFLPASLLGAAVGQVYYQRAAADWAAAAPSMTCGRAPDKLCKYGLPTYLGIALISPWAYPVDLWRPVAGIGELARYLAISGFFS